MDWETVERTVHTCVESMQAIEYEPSRNLRTLWPSMWCEYASIAIAEVLAARGLGEWTFVQASRPGEPNGHAWLEYRDAGGNVLYSIDVTLHQFAGHDAPYVGTGRNPATAEFTQVNFEGRWTDWPLFAHDSTFAKFATETLRHVSGCSVGDGKGGPARNG